MFKSNINFEAEDLVPQRKEKQVKLRTLRDIVLTPELQQLRITMCCGDSTCEAIANLKQTHLREAERCPILSDSETMLDEGCYPDTIPIPPCVDATTEDDILRKAEDEVILISDSLVWYNEDHVSKLAGLGPNGNSLVLIDETGKPYTLPILSEAEEVSLESILY